LRNPGFAWLGADGNYQDTLFIELASKDPSMIYQWYQKNEDGSSTIVAGADSDTLFVKKGQYGIENEGQVYQFYCLVTSGSQYGISSSGSTVYGVGARLANGQWLKFKSFNLGATPAGQAMSVAEQIAYQPSAAAASPSTDKAYDPTVYGDWYQWGRVKDSHQLRTTPATGTYDGLLSEDDGLATSFLDPTTGQVTSGDAVGKFIRRAGTTTNDWRMYPETEDNSVLVPAAEWTWGNPNDVSSNDPCRSELGSPWRVPTQAEWVQMIANNTWQWIDSPAGTSGYEVRPRAKNPVAIFLPAAGRRVRSSGAGANDNTRGYYWSTGTTNASSWALYLTPSEKSMSAQVRAYGMSVRCVAD
jgi:uncharacterized protein (TIGR02145 family)